MIGICFVGAGLATARATYGLSGDLDGATVTVFEQSGGVAGRAATRRRRDVTYDYGANYIKSDDNRVVELVTERFDTDGLVDVHEPIYTFDATGRVSKGRAADGHKWTYERGLLQIAKRLFSRTDATVHRYTRVTGLVRDGEDLNVVDVEDQQWGHSTCWSSTHPLHRQPNCSPTPPGAPR